MKLLVKIVCILVLANAPAYAQNDAAKSRILRTWFDAFRGVRSLSSQSRLTISVNARFKATEGFVANSRIWIDGRKYRAENKNSVTNGEIPAFIHAYDGKNYQRLIADSSSILYISKKAKAHEPSPYLGGLPLILLFDFAFAKGDAKTLETLQRPSTWDYLGKRIKEFKPSTRDGNAGYRMVVTPFVRSSSSLGTTTVFVDGKTLLPTYIEQVANPQGKGEVVRYKVVKTTPVQLPSLKVLPSSILMEGLQGQELILRSTIETQTLKVNIPIPNQVFTIPKSQATTVRTDADEERAIKELQKALAAEKAKAAKAKKEKQ